MYISEHHVCFYSFILGKETSIRIEHKETEKITKEKSKQGLVSDAVKILTKSKQEVISLFNMDSFSFQTYSIVMRLTIC